MLKLKNIGLIVSSVVIVITLLLASLTVSAEPAISIDDRSDSIVLSTSPNTDYLFVWVDEATIELRTCFTPTNCAQGTIDTDYAVSNTFNAVPASGPDPTMRLYSGDYGQDITFSGLNPDGTASNSYTKADFDDGTGLAAVSVLLRIRDPNNVRPPAAGSVIGGNNPEDLIQEDTTGDNSCDAAVGLFGWLMCGVVDIADGVFTFFKNRIRTLLFIDNAQLTNPGLEQSWTNVRNVANTLLLLVALVVIASQIFGFSFLDAYTVKKMVPRVLIAVIFIQLSWFLYTMFISFMNAVGLGVYDLLTYPFIQGGSGTGDIANLFAQATDTDTATTELNSILAFIGGGIGITIGIGALATSGAALSVVFAIIGVLIAILMAVFVLLVRQILILILLVLAPLAIVAWVLPGTQNWWKSWWSLFSKLLLMFPLIMILFAGGTIAANIIFDSFIDTADITGPETAFGIVAMLVAYFAPLFLITGTFKFAGGLFSKILDVGKKAEGKAKGLGYFGMKDRAKETYQQTKKAKGLRLAGDSSTGVRGKFNRTRGRLLTGTLGATGQYGKKVRRNEREEGIKKAEEELKENMYEQGITEYNDQLDYMQFVAMNRGGGHSDAEIQAAALFVAKQQKATRNREIAQALQSQGKSGIWSDVLAAGAAGDVKKVSADVVGKNIQGLRVEEILTQHSSSLEALQTTMISELRSARTPGERNTILRQVRQQLDAARTSSYYDAYTDAASRDALDAFNAEVSRLGAPPVSGPWTGGTPPAAPTPGGGTPPAAPTPGGGTPAGPRGAGGGLPGARPTGGPRPGGIAGGGRGRP